jgi:hypothetical protein
MNTVLNVVTISNYPTEGQLSNFMAKQKATDESRETTEFEKRATMMYNVKAKQSASDHYAKASSIADNIGQGLIVNMTA